MVAVRARGPAVVVSAVLRGAACVGAAAPTARAEVWTDRVAFESAHAGLEVVDFEGLAPEGGALRPAPDAWEGVALRDGTGGSDDTALCDSGYFFGTPTDAFFINRMDLTAALLFTGHVLPEAVGFDVAVGFGGLSAVIEVFRGDALLSRDVLATASERLFTTFIGFSGMGPITAIRVSPGAGGFVLLDNLAHAVPGPGGLAVAGAACAIAGARRRRP